jgi:hypothetical protein
MRGAPCLAGVASMPGCSDRAVGVAVATKSAVPWLGRASSPAIGPTAPATDAATGHLPRRACDRFYELYARFSAMKRSFPFSIAALCQTFFERLIE